MVKNSDTLKKYQSGRPAALSPPKLKAEDWQALLKYSKHTGKLRLNSRRIISDPGTIHRLLANKLIFPDGRLTRQAILKCEALSRQMRTSLAGRAEDLIEPMEEPTEPDVGPIEPVAEHREDRMNSRGVELSDADWAILMTYNRQTGHLLKYDSGTGRMDQGSLEILRDAGALQRLLKNKLIYPGGELTPLAKQICERRERQLQKDTPTKKANHGIQLETKPESQPANFPEATRVSEIEPVSEPLFLIPAEMMPPGEKIEGRGQENLKTGPDQSGTREVDKNLISLLDPQCFESEQFKILRTNIFVPVEGNAPRSVMVTSVAPGEGKSFVSANLAISVARAIDRHVLLMDCDLRRPTGHSLFGFGRVQGLSDYLTDGTPLPTLLQKTKVPKLTLLPAGKPPPNPAELLSSGRMADLVKEVSERYHDRFIIVDSPPPKLTAETFVLASQVDGVILVVKYGSTPRDMVAELIDKMGKDRILGCVLNHFDVRTPGYRYRYYGKYYGKYTIKKKKSPLSRIFGRKQK